MSTNIVDLSILEPGKLPLEVFNEIARLTVTPVIELIITSGQAVLLSKRPTTDQYWPNQYCLPGSIIYSGGPKSLDEYADKILLKYDINTIARPLLIDIRPYTTKRGDELTIIYVVDLGKDRKMILNNNLRFVQITDLGNLDIVEEHLDIIHNFLRQARV